jgi:hypothetical protein
MGERQSVAEPDLVDNRSSKHWHSCFVCYCFSHHLLPQVRTDKPTGPCQQAAISLHERLEKIDALNGHFEQLRTANQRLTHGDATADQ